MATSINKKKKVGGRRGPELQRFCAGELGERVVDVQANAGSQALHAACSQAPHARERKRRS